MVSSPRGGAVQYSRVARGSPKGGAQDDIDESLRVDPGTIDLGGTKLNDAAMPMSAALRPTEIAPASVASDVVVASVARDSTVAATSSAAEPDPDPGLAAQQDTSLIRLDQMRADPRFNWLDGHGLSVAVIDTGINIYHPFFGNRIVYQHDYYYGDPYAVDWTGHGSNVSSIIGSQDGTYTGMAPGVNIIALKVFPDGPGSAFSDDIAAALNWVVANRAAYKIVSVNMSLGEGDNRNTPTSSYYASQFATLAANNTAVVVSSGNNYYDYEAYGVASPSADPNAWSVGGVWDRNAGGPKSFVSGAIDYSTGPDHILAMSQRSPTMTTIFAPGGEIWGATQFDSGVEPLSGTSMAAPHIAGLVADMQQLAMGVSGRFLSVNQLEQTMINGSAWIYDGDDEDVNVASTNQWYHRVDAYGWAYQVLNTLFAGTPGSDTLSGTSVGDVIHGAGGTDSLNGQGGDDTLYGDAAADFLNGSVGNDTLIGGTENDTFFFAAGNGWDDVIDFSHAQADKIDVTSFIGVHNLVQALAGSSQSGADTAISFGGSDGVTLRNVNRANLAASDFDFLPVTTIESVGATAVSVVANTYFLDQSNGLLGPQLRFGGGAIGPGTFGSWSTIGAEQVQGNYQVVFKNGGADQYVVWFTDSSGNYQASTAQVTGASWLVQGLEIPFGQDLNGDGQIGPVTTTIETVGVTTLSHVADSYFLYGHGTTAGPQLRLGGGYVQVGELAAWTPIGAEQVAGNYQVAFKNGGADQYVVWFTDSSGNYQASTAQVTGASWLVQGLEIPFGQDLNGDGTTGPITTTIETAGVTTLANVADSYFLYAHGTTSGPQLKISGAYVAAGQLGAWTPIGAEQVAGNYQVAFKNGGADQYVVWFTDSSGNYQASTGMVSGSSWLVQGLEIPFGQDLNGDGTTGPITTTIETAAATTLAQLADSYFMYAHGTTSGPQLKMSGAYVAVGQFGAWNPLGAERMGDGSGYQLVLKNGGADQYVVWNTDSNGNVVSSGAMMSGSSAALRALEIAFQQDFNSSGQIGTSEVFDQGGDASLFGGGATFDLQGSGTPTSDLALLTNHMASSFVTPAGEGAGVAATPTSDQDFLTKPAA